MKVTRIIENDGFTVDSYSNGTAYNVCFGEAGTPMRNVFVQGGDAVELSDRIEAMECVAPTMAYVDMYAEALEEMGRL